MKIIVMTHIMTFTKRARRTAHTAATLAIAVMATACSSELDQALERQGLDGSTRIAAPTLAAFPAPAASVEVTPGMASRAADPDPVPGGTNLTVTPKSAWEVGDSVLVQYELLTYQSDNIKRNTYIYVTYTVAEDNATLAPKGEAMVLKAEFNTSDNSLTYSRAPSLLEDDLAGGVPVPENAVKNTQYKIDAYYVPGQKWEEAKDKNGNLSGYALRATDNNNIGKYGRAYFNGNFDITDAPTLSLTPSCARLRVHALPGDAVTLSGDFNPTGSNCTLSDTDNSPINSLTAKADNDGNAWFYGFWVSGATLTVQLKSSLTNNENVPVFKATIADVSEKGKTYAIDATAGYSTTPTE